MLKMQGKKQKNKEIVRSVLHFNKIKATKECDECFHCLQAVKHSFKSRISRKNALTALYNCGH